MSRPLRIEFPGAMYHVMAHGTGSMWIYKSPEHMSEFIRIISEVRDKYHFQFHAFVLMRNHYHILLHTPEGNLQEGMLKLNRDYAKTLNRLNKRKGAVFQKRYKAILVEKEEYYAMLLVLNKKLSSPLNQTISSS